MQETPNMFIYSADWYGQKTFRMLPVSEACPFNEVIYDPNTKVLAIVSKDKKDKPQMLPKLNEKGQVIPLKGAVPGNPNSQQYLEERRILETYYEYYIDNVEDMKAFIKIFATNPEHPAVDVINAVAEKTVPGTESSTEA